VVEQPAAIVEEEVEEEQGPIESPPYFEPFPTSEELQITKKDEDDVSQALIWTHGYRGKYSYVLP